jgi:hypothetical protein
VEGKQNPYKPGINIQGISSVPIIFLISIKQRCKLSERKKNEAHNNMIGIAVSAYL